MNKKLNTISEFSEIDPKFKRKHLDKKNTLRNKIEDFEIYNYSQKLKEKLQNQNIFSIPFNLNNKNKNFAIYILSKKKQKKMRFIFFITLFNNI